MTRGDTKMPKTSKHDRTPAKPRTQRKANRRVPHDSTRDRHAVWRAPLGLGLLATMAACSPPAPWVPLRSEVTAAETTLVWVGRGECERFEDGAWVRRPEFDYEFSVEQRRNRGHWESVKSLRRLHPSYDDSAGPRTQTYYFEVGYEAAVGDRVSGALHSSLGDGRVTTDVQFRNATIDIRADVSSFAPFDRYRITQQYLYEGGKLDEVVELSKGDAPWVRNHERATLFAPNTFEAPPK